MSWRVIPCWRRQIWPRLIEQVEDGGLAVLKRDVGARCGSVRCNCTKRAAVARCEVIPLKCQNEGTQKGTLGNVLTDATLHPETRVKDQTANSAGQRARLRQYTVARGSEVMSGRQTGSGRGVAGKATGRSRMRVSCPACKLRRGRNSMTENSSSRTVRHPSVVSPPYL